LAAYLPERKHQFAKPPLDAIRLNIREVLTVYLCLSEIKHAHTDDGVRQEMA
jgi:hypothetical protein